MLFISNLLAQIKEAKAKKKAYEQAQFEAFLNRKVRDEDRETGYCYNLLDYKLAADENPKTVIYDPTLKPFLWMAYTDDLGNTQWAYFQQNPNGSLTKIERE